MMGSLCCKSIVTRDRIWKESGTSCWAESALAQQHFFLIFGKFIASLDGEEAAAVTGFQQLTCLASQSRLSDPATLHRKADV